MASRKYNYQFIEEPSDKLKCLICLEVAEDPKQHEKCGKIFCSKCIEKCEKKPCPACKEESPNYFNDARGAQEIRDIRIQCIYLDQGCDWQGNVGSLIEHLKNCELELVHCKYQYIGCSEKMVRKKIEEHQKEDITKHLHLALQSVATPTLSDSESMIIKIPEYSSLKRNKELYLSKPFYTHSNGYKMCLRIWVNGSGSGEGTHLSVGACIQKGPFDKFLEQPFSGIVYVELLNQKRDCNHCCGEIKFEDNDEHPRPGSEEVKCIEKYLFQSTIVEESSNTQYLKNDSLYIKVSVKLTNCKPWLACGKQMNSEILSIKKNAYQPQVFIVDGYTSKKDKNQIFDTSNFFVSPGGYQMYVSVFPNGTDNGEGTHISIYINITEGPYDAHLSWPVIGMVQFELLNQLADEDHYLRIADITEKANFKKDGSGGFPKFISHKRLQSGRNQYLQGDALYFRVTVTLAEYKPWLTCNLSSY